MAGPTRRKLQTLVLVTLISALIWIYAESQSVKNETDLRPIPVQIPDRVGNKVITSLQPLDEVEVRLTGPAGRLKELRRAAAIDGVKLPIEGLSLEPGLEQISLPEMIEASELFAGTGVSVVEAQPYRVQLQVDVLESRTVPVEFKTDKFLAEPPTLEPNEVTLTMPRAAWADLTGRGVTARVIAEPPSDMGTIAAGEPVKRPVNLRLPEAMRQYRTELDRAMVEVRFTIKDERRSLELTEVPIWMEVSPRELAAYKITLPDKTSLTDVKLSGPSDILDRIEKGEFTPIARVVLGYNTLLGLSGKGPSELPVSYELVPTRLITGAGNAEAGTRSTAFWPDALKVEAEAQTVTVTVEPIS